VSAGGSPTPGGSEYPALLPNWRRRGLGRWPTLLGESPPALLPTLRAPAIPTGATRARYRFLVDWDNDGAFVGTGEDVTSTVRNVPAVKISLGRNQAREYSPPIAGQASFSLDNSDGTYSSNNASSALYGRLNPGVLVQIWATLGTASYQMHEGYLDVPAERPGPRQQLIAESSLDGFAKLRAATISTAEYTNIPIHQAIGVVLDAAGWPAGKRALIVGGHQPGLRRVAAYAVSGPRASWAGRKGGLWWLESRARDSEPQVVVRAVIAPDLL